MIYDIIILGAGPAGIYGTYYANLNGLKVLLLEIDQFIGGKPMKLYPLKPIYDIPGFTHVTGKEYAQHLIDQLHSQHHRGLYEIKTQTDIVDIKKQDNIFHLTDQHQQVYQGKYVILATGYSSFQYHSIPKEQVLTNKPIHYVIDDLSKFKDKKVVIFGGGDSAFDNALLLKDVAKSITLVHRNDKFKAHHHSIHTLQEVAHANILTNTLIESVNDKEIVLKQGSTTINLDYDEIIVC